MGLSEPRRTHKPRRPYNCHKVVTKSLGPYSSAPPSAGSPPRNPWVHPTGGGILHEQSPPPDSALPRYRIRRQAAMGGSRESRRGYVPVSGKGIASCLRTL